MKRFILSAVVLFSIFAAGNTIFSQIILQGIVTDNGAEFLGNGAEPVENAIVTLTDQADINRFFIAYTNGQGEYEIQISATAIENIPSLTPGTCTLFQNYPNPFNPSTVIGYQLSHPGTVCIDVYNILGKKVKTLLDEYQSSQTGCVVWDGTNDLGEGVPAGVYIYSLKAMDTRIVMKMLLLDGHQGQTNASAAYNFNNQLFSTKQSSKDRQISDIYNLSVTGADIETYQQSGLEITTNTTINITVQRTVTDIDNNVYSTVKIGDQWWMAENLKVTSYRNGDAIPNITNSTEWTTLSTGAYCCYGNNTANVSTYGQLYNWHAVNDSRNIAPTDWHVPTDDDWKELEMTLGMSQADADNEGRRGTDEGGKLKEADTAHWSSPNTGANNESGFTALPGGSRYSADGSFYLLGHYGNFWASTEYDTDNARLRYLRYNYSEIYRSYYDKRWGISVRCIKDN